MLNKLFKLNARTTITTEILAGITTFGTMAYVLAVMPVILAGTGMDKEAVFLATCIGTGILTIAMGLIANIPVGLAPAMGPAAYFAAIAAQNGGIPWTHALGAVFIAGIIFIILTLTQMRKILIDAIPNSLKSATTVGIGLFLALIGCKMSHLVVINTHLAEPNLLAIVKNGGIAHLAFFEWDLSLGKFSEATTLLSLIGLVLTSIMITLNIRGAILLGIILTTIVGIPLGLTDLSQIKFTMPTFHNLVPNAFSCKGILNASFISIVFTFLFISLMDTFATLMATTTRAGLLNTPESKNTLRKAMLVDSTGLSLAAFLGIPTISYYIESMSGIGAGGKTGLTAVTIGILFFIALILGPLFVIIPSAATAPVLIIIGALIISTIRDIEFKDFTETLPVFLTIILIPFTYNIANGISAGIVFYVILKLITKKFREIHWMMYLLSILITVRYLFFT